MLDDRRSEQSDASPMSSAFDLSSLSREAALLAEIGIGLTGLGFLFLFLGVLFFFDKGLIALGNVRLPLLRMGASTNNVYGDIEMCACMCSSCSWRASR
jgi:hypothetical protein